MKLIYPMYRPHSVQRSLISNPPKDYKFTKTISELDNYHHKFYWQIQNRLSYNPFVRLIWSFYKKIQNPILKKYNSLFNLDSDPEIKKADILLSGIIIPTKKPYWIDLEHVRQLMGWDINLFRKNREWISKHLSKDNCKLITSWTKAGINTVIQNLPDSDKFKHKCFFVHNAIPSVNFKRKFNDKKEIKFLFMSSYSLPYDFNFKGGNIVLESFSRLVKKYPKIELIVKAWVPKYLIKKYSKIKQIKFQGISPFSEMDKVFRDIDIFLSPNHNTPAQAYLDCMNYSIPIITTDLWANSEIVKNNYNGLLIQSSRKIPYFVENNIPNSRSKEFNKAIDKIDENMVLELIEKAEKLINNWKLRKHLGENGKKEIETGEFSITKRNKKYKKLLDKFF